MNETIEFESIHNFEKTFNDSEKHSILLNSVIKNGIQDCCSSRESEVENSFNFSISINAGEITNQKKSGRCW